MTDVRLVLNMIVKNESKTLPRMLDSVKDVVTGYCVVDTGSDDRTVDVLNAYNIQPYLEPFVNFEVTRNVALNAALSLVDDCDKAHTYLLLCDADMELQLGSREELFRVLRKDQPDVVMITQRSGSLVYNNVRLVRASCPDLHYVCPTHEYLSHPSTAKVITLPDNVAWFLDHADGGSRGNKLERDRRLLENAPQATARTLFYLAQTYRDLGLIDLAISTYFRRIDIGGWIEEVVYSRYMLLKMYLHNTHEIDKAVEQASLIWHSGRRRPEPFYHLCAYFRERSDIPEAVKYLAMAQMSLYDVGVSLPLFYESNIGDIHLPFQEYMLWFYMHPKDRTQVAELATRLLAHPDLSEDLKTCIECNYKQYYSTST